MESQSIRDALARIRGVHVGVDIGQKVDYTAIVVAEVGERPSAQTYRDWHGNVKTVMEATYRVHELRRLPLGTPFVAVAEEVVKVVAAVHEMERQMRRDGYLRNTSTRSRWMCSWMRRDWARPSWSWSRTRWRSRP